MNPREQRKFTRFSILLDTDIEKTFWFHFAPDICVYIFPYRSYFYFHNLSFFESLPHLQRLNPYFQGIINLCLCFDIIFIHSFSGLDTLISTRSPSLTPSFTNGLGDSHPSPEHESYMFVRIYFQISFKYWLLAQIDICPWR